MFPAKKSLGRVRQAGPALVNRAPRGSRPCGFDPRAHSVLLAGGTRAKGPPLCGVVITARRAGALLTGLATALAVGSRRAGVAITAPKAGAISPPPLRFGRSIHQTAIDTRTPRCKVHEYRKCGSSHRQAQKETSSSAVRDQGAQSPCPKKPSPPVTGFVEHERQLILRFKIGKS